MSKAHFIAYFPLFRYIVFFSSLWFFFLFFVDVFDHGLPKSYFSFSFIMVSIKTVINGKTSSCFFLLTVKKTLTFRRHYGFQEDNTAIKLHHDIHLWVYWNSIYDTMWHSCTGFNVCISCLIVTSLLDSSKDFYYRSLLLVFVLCSVRDRNINNFVL